MKTGWLTLSPGQPLSPWGWHRARSRGRGSAPGTSSRIVSCNTWSGHRARSRPSTRRAAQWPGWTGSQGRASASLSHCPEQPSSSSNVQSSQSQSSSLLLFTIVLGSSFIFSSFTFFFLLKCIEAVLVDYEPIRIQFWFQSPIRTGNQIKVLSF